MGLRNCPPHSPGDLADSWPALKDSQIRAAFGGSLSISRRIGSTWAFGCLHAQVMRDGGLDFRQFFSGQVVNGITDDVLRVDRTDLIDEQPCRSACYF